MKVKGIAFNQVKNFPDAIRGYQEADKKLAMVEMLYDMRKKAGLTKSTLAGRMGISPSDISRLEGNPLVTSMKTLGKYALACGADINILAVY